MREKKAAAETKQTCSLPLTECLNCTGFTDMSSRIDAIESKVLMLPGAHLIQMEKKQKNPSLNSDASLSD